MCSREVIDALLTPEEQSEVVAFIRRGASAELPSEGAAAVVALLEQHFTKCELARFLVSYIHASLS